MKNSKKERIEKLDRLHSNSNLDVLCHSAMAIYQRKETTGASTGRFVPLQRTADCHVSMAPYPSRLGPSKSGAAHGNLEKARPPKNACAKIGKGMCQNAVGTNMRAKEHSNFITSVYSRMHRTTREKQNIESLCNHSTLNEIKNGGVMRGEVSECEILKQKNILVAKWIIDCEEETKRERKRELIDSRIPWWMKTALERRSSRFKRRNKDRHKLNERW